jgi:hypothetical protein
MISVDPDDQLPQSLRLFFRQKVKDSLQVVGQCFFDLAKKLALVCVLKIRAEFDGPSLNLLLERGGEILEIPWLRAGIYWLKEAESQKSRLFSWIF